VIGIAANGPPPAEGGRDPVIVEPPPNQHDTPQLPRAAHGLE
jgi:hypothetical protein